MNTPETKHVRRIPYLTAIVAVATIGLVLACVVGVRYRSWTQHRAAATLDFAGITLHFSEDREPQPTWERLVFGDNQYDGVRRIDVTDIEVPQRQLLAMEVFRTIDCFRLERCRNADAVMQQLSKLPGLLFFEVIESPLTNEGLRHLSNHPSLEFMTFKHSLPQDADMSFVQSLARLRGVWLSGDNVDDRMLKDIARNANVTKLILARTRATHEGLHAFSGLTLLQISDQWLSSRELEVIAANSTLTHLELANCEFRADIDIGLKTATARQESTSSHMPLPDQLIQRIAVLPHLREVSLKGTPLEENAVDRLAAMPKLKWVALDGTGLSEMAVKRLREQRPDVRVRADP